MSFSRTLQRHRSLSMVVLLCSVLSGCDQIFDSLIDCIDGDKPVLEGALPSPILNQEYNEGITVGIRNEPYDDLFNYRFELTGNLPVGIQQSSTGRSFRLFGTPIETGEYNFRISVQVKDRRCE